MLRTLRGTPLRSETYALDGSPREQNPYTVSESLSLVREEATPGNQLSGRRRIFSPFSVASRTTQWERGDDPMTQFSFTAKYDDFGQPQQSWQIACPQDWRDIFSTSKDYLASYSETIFAKPGDPDKTYIVDRPATAKSYEIKIQIPQTLLQIKQAVESGQFNKQLIGHTLTFYDGEEYTGLPLRKIGAHGFPSRTETLVLTKERFN